MSTKTGGGWQTIAIFFQKIVESNFYILSCYLTHWLASVDSEEAFVNNFS